jgi:hypothetical protein
MAGFYGQFSGHQCDEELEFEKNSKFDPFGQICGL